MQIASLYKKLRYVCDVVIVVTGEYMFFTYLGRSKLFPHTLLKTQVTHHCKKYFIQVHSYVIVINKC